MGLARRRVAAAILAMSIGCADGSVSTVPEAKVWFVQNAHQFIEIRDLLLEHPNIRRVEDGTYPDFREYAPFSAADHAAYAKIERLMTVLKINHVTVARERNQGSGHLISIRMNLYARGFLGDGQAISVSYILSQNLIGRYSKPGGDTRAYALSLPDWYVVASGFPESGS